MLTAALPLGIMMAAQALTENEVSGINIPELEPRFSPL
jgi:hypothetical protein